MRQFHVCKKIKQFFLVLLSVVFFTCSIPSFSIRSEAAEVAGYTFAFEAFLALQSYLSLHGYGLLKSSDGTSIGSIKQWSNAGSDTYNNIAYDIALGLDKLFPSQNAGNKFLANLYLAQQLGKFVIDNSLASQLAQYIETKTEEGAFSAGTLDFSVDSLAITGQGYTASYPGYNTSFDVQNYTWIPCEFSVNGIIYFFAIPTVTSFIAGTVNNNGIVLPGGNTMYQVDYGTYRTNAWTRYWKGNLTHQFSTTAVCLNGDDYVVNNDPEATIRNILALYYAGQLVATSVATFAEQLTDTSNSDLLTETNTIAQDGTVEGSTTIYLPDSSTLEALLEAYSAGQITYDDLVNAFGLATAASDASAQTKEDALSDVIVAPDIYNWITKTEWGGYSITKATSEVSETEALENEKAESIADRLGWPSGSEPDQEDKDKAGMSMLLATIAMWLGLWEWPDTDPTAPDGGGTDPDDNPFEEGRAADVIAGVGVASSLIGDIFNAAGGSSGYGMIFTVGISFVLFSVIIGAGHFLGGLGNHAEIKSKASNNVPEKPAQSGKQVARSGQHRHINVKKGA